MSFHDRFPLRLPHHSDDASAPACPRRPRAINHRSSWLRFRLIGVVVAILSIGFVAANVMSYRDAVDVLKANILHHELPLTGSNIYSEVQSDLIRPVFISSQMANDTFVKDWLLGGEQGSDKIVRYLDAIRQKYGVFTNISTW